MPNSVTANARYCPKCGKNTSASTCPDDDAPTFARDGSSAGALNYEAGKIVTGKYKIGQRLGRGGFGAVYSAENMTTSHNVAIKVLAIDPDDTDDSMIQRFLQEAQVTAKLKHPNTIRVFDFGQTDEGALFMVMEMLNGPTLEKLLKDNEVNGSTMTERETLNLAIPILRSLAEAHDHALVHRDLKPLNIMLTDASDDERIVKVLDFGIARKQDSQLTGTGKALGTPAYMSPEQCRGGNLDGRSDLYALGTIMFRCVTGRLPFAADNQLALLYAQINDRAPDVRSLTKQTLSVGFVASLQRALEKDPRSRFENAKAMRQELESVLGGAWAGTPVHPMAALDDVTARTAEFVVESTRVVDAAGGATLQAEVGWSQPALVAGAAAPTVAVDREAVAAEPQAAQTTKPAGKPM